MKSDQAFTTLIYKSLLRKTKRQLAELNSELIYEISVLADEDEDGQKWSQKNYPLGYTSYGSRDKLFDFSPNFDELKQEVQKHCKIFAQELRFKSEKRLEMVSMWANVMPQGAYHTQHIHPHSVLSGTYYVQLPKVASTLKFEDPRLGLFMNAPPREGLYLELTPKAGEIVLFESWLRHEVLQNKSREPRISISFNFDWKNRA